METGSKDILRVKDRQIEDQLAGFMSMVMDRLVDLEKSFDRVEKDIAELKISSSEKRLKYKRNLEALRAQRKWLLA